MDLRVISLERYLVVGNGAVQRKARAGANRERHKGLAVWPSLRGYGSNRKVGAATRSRPGHTARALHPRNIISTSAPMTNVPTATDTNTSRMAMTSPSWPLPIALLFYRPTAASAVDQPTSLSSPLAPTAQAAPVPYLPANIFDTSEPMMQADSVRSNVCGNNTPYRHTPCRLLHGSGA